jgi:hypothetical protein
MDALTIPTANLQALWSAPGATLEN